MLGLEENPAMDYNQELKKQRRTQYSVTTADQYVPSVPLKVVEMAILVHHQFAPHVQRREITLVRLIGLTAVAVLMISLMIISQISKGSHGT